MEAVMLSLIAWLNLNTEYDMQVPLPNLVFLEQGLLCENYGIDSPAMCEATKLVGFYDKNVTIYLKLDFDIHNPKHQSYLLHELVHYVQWHNGKSHQSDCWGELEVEAYNLQDRWHNQQNKLAQPTDPFKLIMLEASCDA